MNENASRRHDGPGSTGGGPGRNAPCPCGSGKKHRRCCGRRAAAGAAHGVGQDEDLSDITLEDLKDLFPAGAFDKIAGELGRMDEKELAEFLDSFDDMDEEEIEEILGGPDEDEEEAESGVGKADFMRLVGKLADGLGKDGKLGEDAAFEIALADHPEYAKASEKGDLPHEIEGPDGNVMNPRLHLAFHAIMERQITADEPRGVAGILKRLQVAGVTRHEAVHAMANKVTDQTWYMLREGCPFDEERYMKELEELARKHEKDGGG